MALEKGEKAPGFVAEATSGEQVSAARLKGRRYVLYFYPKDFSLVCTKQACAFRDEFEHLRGLEVLVWGVSRDNLDTHRAFRKKHDLPFHLLSDLDGSISAAFKVRVPILGLTKRVTYLIGESGLIEFAHEEMLGSRSHVTGLREALRLR